MSYISVGARTLTFRVRSCPAQPQAIVIQKDHFKENCSGLQAEQWCASRCVLCHDVFVEIYGEAFILFGIAYHGGPRRLATSGAFTALPIVFVRLVAGYVVLLSITLYLGMNFMFRWE